MERLKDRAASAKSTGGRPAAGPPPARHDRDGLRETGLPADPLELFTTWHREWAATGPPDAAAAVLATADAEGRPSARHVDLARTDHGLVFFTVHLSGKALDLAVNPRAEMCFGWLGLGRQVRAAGPVERLDALTDDDHYTRLPRAVQLLAWATDQRAVVPDASTVRDAVDAVTARFTGQEVPRPGHWGGYRLVPETVEFWQDRPDLVPDRIRYRHRNGGWLRERLAP